MAIVVSYAIYILYAKERSGISVDRASDNVYYLGLLFTLVSLAYSLTRLAASLGEGRVLEAGYVLGLLPDFGVALFSTIAGIVGRIVLQQSTADGEEQAREALRVAMRQLRDAIERIIMDLNGLSAQTKVALGEVSQHVTATLKHTALQTTEAVNKSTSEAIDALKTTTSESAEVINKATDTVKAATDSIASLLEQALPQIENAVNTAKDEIDRLLVDIRPIAKQLENASDAVASIRSIDESVKENARDAAASLQAVDESVKSVGALIEAMGKTVDEMKGETVKNREESADRMASLRSELMDAVGETVKEVARLREVLRPIAEKLEAEGGLDEQLKAVNASVKLVDESVRSVGASIEAMGRQADEMKEENVKDREEAADRMASLRRELMDVIDKAVNEVTRLREDIRPIAANFQAGSGLDAQLKSVDASLQRVDEQIKAVSKAVKAAGEEDSKKGWLDRWR